MNVLIIDDEPSIRKSTAIAVDSEGHYAETAADSTVALQSLKEDSFDLVLLDLRLGDENGLDVLPRILEISPKSAVVVFTAHASVDTAVEAMKLGALDYMEKPFTPADLRLLFAKVQKTRTLTHRVEELEVEVGKNNPPLLFETRDPPMQEVLDTLFRAADTQASILILGESGTGKSVVAQAVHQRSLAANKPFVTVSCPSLSRELLESELFGHVRGAFTGAMKDKWGKVKAADGGTLFLDEIGELPGDLQPKLLRLLQEREYERVGETKTREASARMISATNRDLDQAVQEGAFREDLLYRLNVITVCMPALRERPADLLDLATHYLEFFSKQTGRGVTGFTKAATDRLLDYQWPGNLRELRNAVERAVILAENGSAIDADDLPGNSNSADVSDCGEHDTPTSLGAEASLDEIEKEHIRRVLERAETIQEAADILGVDQSTLYRKRKAMELD